MGDAIDKLIALSGTEHVKAYTKKDGTHVSAHTRDEGHAGHGVFRQEAPTPSGKVTYDPSNPEHPKPKFEVGQTVVKGNGKKLWIIRDRQLTKYGTAPYRWQFAVKNYDTGKSSSLWHGEGELNLAHEGADAQAQGEATKALKEKLAQHKASYDAKAAQERTQGQSEGKSQPLPGKVVKYSTKRPNKAHPKPIEADQIDGRDVIDKRLKQLPDGSFKWEYLLHVPNSNQGEWVTK